MKKVDVIVVGLGLAGAVLSRRLKHLHKSVFAFDNNEPSTSSKIAAGLVNPITGRRFVKSWMFDELNASARDFYHTWEEEQVSTLVYEMPILRAMEDYRFIDDVEAKLSDPHYQQFIEAATVDDSSYIKPAEINYKINQGYRVDIQELLKWSREWLEKENNISYQAFDYSQLHISSTGIKYKELEADYIIFCEGAAGQSNPWFNYLPFQPTKGELFELKEKAPLPYAYKRNLFLLPVGKDLLWCGSLSFWDFDDDQPSDEGEEILLQKLRKVYRHDPFIHNHLAAIRPTVRDRRPLVGIHPEHTRMAIFNGLGTKGTLLAPYFSNQLVSFLFEEGDILPEANITRFDRK